MTPKKILKTFTKLLTLFLITTSTISDPFFSPQDRANNGKIFAHSRLIILPSPEKNPINRPTIIQSCSKRKFSQALKEKIKYDYHGDENAIAFRRLEENGHLTDEVMEVSFHFGGEVKNWFLKKFLKYSENLESNERLEIFYGFDKKSQPVVKGIVKSVHAEDGGETKYRVDGDSEELISVHEVKFYMKIFLIFFF